MGTGLVTGDISGIGAATATGLLSHGRNVAAFWVGQPGFGVF